jgi:hypothetical protein
MDVEFWNGERDRAVRLQRPCECGCDERDRSERLVGYLTGSDSNGEGFTLYMPDEATYQRFASVFGGEA